ncbi:hypothetical protein D0T85_14615 [Bacteroides sp. 519]|nr:hypothetical protein [Bacteroides sp. 519]
MRCFSLHYSYLVQIRLELNKNTEAQKHGAFPCAEHGGFAFVVRYKMLHTSQGIPLRFNLNNQNFTPRVIACELFLVQIYWVVLP